MPKIRTLVFTTLFPSTARPGHGLFVETRLQHLLASEEIETRVVAPVPWFPSQNSRYGRWAVFAATPRFEHRSNVQVWHPRYPLPPRIGMAAAPLLLAMGARATVAELLRQQDVDLFDAHYYYPDGVAAALLSKWFNKPFVVTGRGTDLNLIANFRIPLAWIRWTERNANASILVSEALKQRLASISGTSARLNVVRNGVDTRRFFPIDRRRCCDKLSLSENRWILAVGNLVPEKGLAIAIDALDQLPKDTRLAIVGEGSDRPRLERLVNNQGLRSRVLFAGRREQSELPYWYGAAELLVLCSEREGLPNVLLESMACGTPVVARAVGGVPEIVNNKVGQLVFEGTAKAFATAISDVLRNPPSAEKVREHASKFSWEEATRAQLTLFRSIAKTSVQTNPSVAPIL